MRIDDEHAIDKHSFKNQPGDRIAPVTPQVLLPCSTEA